MSVARVSLVLFAMAMLLTACGQRGDLYIPEPDREAVLTVPAAQPDPDDEDEDVVTPPAAAPAPDAGNAGQ